MEELTLSFCLRELADNMKRGSYGIRIGRSLLDFVDVALDESSMPNKYRVIACDGEEFFFSDLMQAICKFIAINK